MFTCQVLTDTGALERLRLSWQLLVSQSATATPFQTFEWISTWWETLGHSKKPYVLTVFEGKDLVGLYLGYEQPGMMNVLLPMGKGISDYLHPLIKSGYETAVIQYMIDFIKEQKRFQLIDFHQIRETHPLNRVEGGKFAIQEECFVLDLPETFDAYVQTLSKSMRYEAKRIERGDFKKGLAKVQTLTNPSDALSALKMLFDLHRKRWKQKGLPGVFFLKHVQDFHESYIVKALEAKQLKLAVYSQKENIVGAIYVMKLGKTSYFYQSGFDPNYKICSPGSVLVAHSIRETIEEGGNQFDFLRGAEPYKARWKPQRIYKNLRVMLPLKSIRGTLAVHVNQSWTKASRQALKKLQKVGV